MRLPPSSLRSLSVYFPLNIPVFGVMLVLFGLMPANAAASAQLTCSPPNLGFGNVVVGQNETLTLTVTNGGSTSVTVSSMTVSDSAFVTSKLSLPQVIAAGQSVALTVSFTPTANGYQGGTIKLLSNASNETLVLQAGGTGVTKESVTASPSLLSFGKVAVGGSASLPLVLTNSESWSLKISGVKASVDDFSIDGPAFPLTLGAGQSISLTVYFAPQSTGVAGGSVFVFGPGLSIPLTGAGTGKAVGELAIGPSPLNYGNVTVGTTDTLPIAVSTTGGSVTISSATSSSSQFVLQGESFPLTIASGQSVSLNVAFTPTSTGTVSGSLTFASNASNSSATESLTGVGTQTPYSIALYWNASAEAVGYNIYRRLGTSGSFSKVNPALDANTAYTDSTVVGGNTYYYAATTVNSAGQESARSTPAVEAVVP
jgi:hypothetical protein